ncbi:glycosyltransferase family 32 protein [Roseburia faecis]|uniref:glycosyltransferase family 32 protein n=1 Tax=Roseburia faecis TaxID=301302 RepID=UPI003F9A93B2
MIPKKIHYFWFGYNEKPKEVISYINTWKRYFPEYEIIEWNETNFDINCCKYTKQAYEAKKYAFVSDYARIYVLYYIGGIYFDTDIEVCKPFENLLENRKMVLGFEDEHYIMTAFMASEARLECFGKLLKEYQNRSFIKKNGGYDTLPNPVIVTEIMKNYLIPNGKRQTFQMDCEVYPYDYFSAFHIARQKLNVTENTVCIHHCMGTWQTKKDRIKPWIKSKIIMLIGEKNFETFKNIFVNKGKKSDYN